jgi:hypothetical protein
MDEPLNTVHIRGGVQQGLYIISCSVGRSDPSLVLTVKKKYNYHSYAKRLTEVVDDKVALLVVHHLGVLVGDALAPADGVAPHQDAVRGGRRPHDRDLIRGGLETEGFFSFECPCYR